MGKKIRQVSVLVNPGKSGVGELLKQLKSLFRTHGVKSRFIEDKRSNHRMASTKSPVHRRGDEMIIVAGGDGTLLQAARRSVGSGIPLLGINAGSLGFLTTLPREGVSQALPRILMGEYAISSRMALQVKVIRQRKVIERGWALNEAALTRGPHARLVSLIMHLNGNFRTEYNCDGLIVATPTGSTGYSVAAGGPLLSTSADVLCVTPICAHSLTNRPLVVNRNEKIKVEIPAKSPGILLHTDGLRCARLKSGDMIEYAPARETVPLARLPEVDFYSVLRQKLRWSGTTLG
jgi:NAD+ kinase